MEASSGGLQFCMYLWSFSFFAVYCMCSFYIPQYIFKCFFTAVLHLFWLFRVSLQSLFLSPQLLRFPSWFFLSSCYCTALLHIVFECILFDLCFFADIFCLVELLFLLSVVILNLFEVSLSKKRSNIKQELQHRGSLTPLDPCSVLNRPVQYTHPWSVLCSIL